jgi:hypothetical protein
MLVVAEGTAMRTTIGRGAHAHNRDGSARLMGHVRDGAPAVEARFARGEELTVAATNIAAVELCGATISA